jgi:chromosome segregation ATPase
MKPMRQIVILLTLALVATGGILRAAEPASAEGKLRDALRDATLQLRSCETERASLKAANASLTDENKALAQKAEALRKQLIADGDAAEKEKAALKAQTTACEQQTAALKTELDRMRGELDKAGAAVRGKAADIHRLSEQKADIQSSLDDMEGRNIELYTLASEILKRYQEFSFGEALKAKEPFVGKTRTRLETLIQGYESRLIDVKLAANDAAAKAQSDVPSEQKEPEKAAPFVKQPSSVRGK